jgi:transcriptional regulator with XRE-family HTH domain
MLMIEKPISFPALLVEYGIETQAELRRRTGLSRQYAWNLWHDRFNIGGTLAVRLAEQLGIPVERLLQVKPRLTQKAGRPPKEQKDE